MFSPFMLSCLPLWSSFTRLRARQVQGAGLPDFNGTYLPELELIDGVPSYRKQGHLAQVTAIEPVTIVRRSRILSQYGAHEYHMPTARAG